MQFKPTPRTFVMQRAEGYAHVPHEPVRVDMHTVVCCCIYLCKQFDSYTADAYGRKIIPTDAKCPYVSSRFESTPMCDGGFQCENGQFIDKPGWGRLYKYVSLSGKQK